MYKWVMSGLSVLAINLSACATTPDPAKRCTADWIAPRADAAMSDFKRKTKPVMRKLRKNAERLSKGQRPNSFQMFSLVASLSQLEQTFSKGRAIKDLKTLANTCNDPKVITTAMTNFMKEQGLTDQFIGFVETLPQYRSLIEQGLRDIAPSP